MSFGVEWMRNQNRYQTVTVRNGHNFGTDRWIAVKLLLEFPDALLHRVDEESILGDDEVWSRHA